MQKETNTASVICYQNANRITCKWQNSLLNNLILIVQEARDKYMFNFPAIFFNGASYYSPHFFVIYLL